MNGDNTHLTTLSAEIVYALLDSLGNRAHSDDDILGILRAIVGEGLVLTACDGRNLSHSLSHHIGHCIVELVRCLASLEVDIGVLRCTACNGCVGVKRTLAELLQRLAIEHCRERCLVDKLNLLNLV